MGEGGKTPRFSAKREVLEALRDRLANSRTDALRASVITLLIQAFETMSEAALRKLAGIGK